MGNRGSDLGKTVRGLEREWSKDGTVEGMDRIVSRTRMVTVLLEQVQGDGAGPHVEPLGQVARRDGGAQQREGVERRHFRIVGILLVQLAHRVHVAYTALCSVTLSPEDLDGAQEALFTLRGRFGQSLTCGWSQALERSSRLRRVHPREQGVVVGERLAPVRHGEARIDPLSRAELLAGLYPTEAVQKGHSPEEVLLRLTRRGHREFEGTHVIELGLGGSGAHHEEARDQQKGRGTIHRSLLRGKGHIHTAASFATDRPNIAPKK